jgi:aminomuconate-semialdehyde/2-hydroxymuconate-6-semialdehyde dehydrogenase
MDKLDLFIDGKYVAARDDKRFGDVDPARGETFAQIAEASRDDVDRAVTAAKRALRGPWGKMSAADRADLLEKVAARISERFDDFLRAEMRDTGKPRASAAAIDIPRGGANFRIFAQMLRTFGT